MGRRNHAFFVKCRYQLSLLFIETYSGVFRIYKRGRPTFNKLKSCNKAESLTEILVGVRMIF